MRKQTEEWLRLLTLEEKAQLCTGKDGMWTTPIERLGIPAIKLSDGPNGLRDGDTTCFPSACALACTFDPEATRAVGKAIGEECRTFGVHMLLGPGVNMKRSVLCGRNFEYYSEDPYLTGELAAAYVEGLQSEGVSACVKHFACNNQETRRMSSDSILDEQTLREIYLPAFETIVRKAHPKSVMCSYNRINGTFSSDNRKLLTEILRNEWGFDGLVVSDWGAINDRVESLKAGTDLEMPASACGTQTILDALRDGRLREEELDLAVGRILDAVLELTEAASPMEYDREEHRKLARRVAAESVVLLKNNNKILPIDQRYRKIAVIGEFAEVPRIQGSGSAKTRNPSVETPLSELRNLCAGKEIRYAKGYSAEEERYDVDLAKDAAQAAAESDVAVFFLGLPTRVESEGYDRKDIEIPANQLAVLSAVVRANRKTVVVMQNGSAVNCDWADAVPAVLESYFLGSCCGGAIADVLTGAVNPGGKLAETFPMRLEDTPAYLEFPGTDEQVRYGEGIYIGYRYYLSRKMHVKFPFGYGLSYTRFQCENVFAPSKIRAGEGLKVEFDLANTGKYDGSEVIQVYLRALDVRRPDKELIGFRKCRLRAGEKASFVIDIAPEAFRTYSNRRNRYEIRGGNYELIVGNSCTNEDAVLPLFLEKEPDVRYDRNTCLGELLKTELGREIVEKELMGSLCLAIYGAFFMDVKLVDGKTEDPFFNHVMENMPLRALSNFSDGHLTPAQVEEILRRMNGEEE